MNYNNPIRNNNTNKNKTTRIVIKIKIIMRSQLKLPRIINSSNRKEKLYKESK